MQAGSAHFVAKKKVVSICPILFGFLFLLLYYTPTTVGICVHVNKSFPSPPNNLYMILHLKQMAFPSKPLNLDCCSTLGQGGSWEVQGPRLPSRGNSSESSINLPQSHSRPVTGWPCPAPRALALLRVMGEAPVCIVAEMERRGYFPGKISSI